MGMVSVMCYMLYVCVTVCMWEKPWGTVCALLGNVLYVTQCMRHEPFTSDAIFLDIE